MGVPRPMSLAAMRTARIGVFLLSSIWAASHLMNEPALARGVERENSHNRPVAARMAMPHSGSHGAQAYGRQVARLEARLYSLSDQVEGSRKAIRQALGRLNTDEISPSVNDSSQLERIYQDLGALPLTNMVRTLNDLAIGNELAPRPDRWHDLKLVRGQMGDFEGRVARSTKDMASCMRRLATRRLAVREINGAQRGETVSLTQTQER